MILQIISKAQLTYTYQTNTISEATSPLVTTMYTPLINAAPSSSQQHTHYQYHRKKMTDNRLVKYNSFRNPLKHEVRKVQQNQRSVDLILPKYTVKDLVKSRRADEV